ncbi:MAG: hypothetical protein H6721_33620 [Sandaracinus sp.]|nr:hypothetical protein [Sandaracinus sp.]MCB9637075.1 hypothetical protein [Sandaracinus sp.]
MTGPIPAERRSSTAKDLRRLRARRLVLRMTLGVVLPTAIAAVYVGLVATPEYESVSSFTIQSADGVSASSVELLFAAIPGSSAGRDVLLVQEHVRSRAMLQQLVDEHGWLEHYQSPDVDWFGRLPADATLEERYTHFVDKVRVEHDTQSGTLSLRVMAYDAESAKRFADAILAASENMVNTLAQRAREDRIELAQRELTRAEGRLSAARSAVLELQNQGAELNPVASAAALLELRGELEAELARARAELSAMRSTYAPTAPEVVQQQQRVRALERQLDAQRARLAGEEGQGLSEAIARFEPLVAEKEFAERAYGSALASLEVARVEAHRQHRYLVTIAPPSAPDAPTHPRFWYSVLTVLVASFFLLGIGTLLVASVREHAQV